MSTGPKKNATRPISSCTPLYAPARPPSLASRSSSASEGSPRSGSISGWCHFFTESLPLPGAVDQGLGTVRLPPASQVRTAAAPFSNRRSLGGTDAEVGRVDAGAVDEDRPRRAFRGDVEAIGVLEQREETRQRFVEDAVDIAPRRGRRLVRGQLDPDRRPAPRVAVVRSNTSTGKLSSSPPSTHVAVRFAWDPGVRTRTRTGSKKNGIDMDARTASTMRCRAGSSPYSG